MADTLQQLWDRGMLNPELKSLAELTSKRMPKLSIGEGQYRPEQYGETTTGVARDPTIGIDTKQILAAGNPQALANNVFHHELIHALDDSMSKQAVWAEKNTPEKERFADAYEKLNPRKLLEQHINLLQKRQDESPSPKRSLAVKEAMDMLEHRNTEGKLYRGNSGEMRAFATANALQPKRKLFPAYYKDDFENRAKGVAHIDPTVATETAILMDLAQRARNSKEPEHVNLIRQMFSK